uniref:Uncharacterized protein n=1 Tax=Pithovirus LCPAC201 TaxID=2506591 RepID=A0A481Z540_9VIRU|nr:MAG: hypothetical protein LCPAC201_02850 [Pithovirus LCPAC201]
MDFDRVAWFMAGLIIGNLLNTFTTITLLFIWLVARNQVLPLCLGGYHPQDVLANFFQIVSVWLSLISPFRFSKKNFSTISSKKIPNSPKNKNTLMIENFPSDINEITNFSLYNSTPAKNISRPITLLVSPIETPRPPVIQTINYSPSPIPGFTTKSRPIIFPPTVSQMNSANYGQPGEIKLQLIVSKN